METPWTAAARPSVAFERIGRIHTGQFDLVRNARRTQFLKMAFTVYRNPLARAQKDIPARVAKNFLGKALDDPMSGRPVGAGVPPELALYDPQIMLFFQCHPTAPQRQGEDRPAGHVLPGGGLV